MQETNRGIFVGRQFELSVLRAALESALDGAGQVALVSGEAGIGKSRLCEEFLAGIDPGTATVFRSWCPEDSGAPPYWPWTILARAVAETRPKRFEQFMATPGGPVLAELLQGSLSLANRAAFEVPASSDQERFRFFDCISRFLLDDDQPRPAVFFIDDLHAADFSTQLLLKFLAREIAARPALFLGTYRDSGLTAESHMDQTATELKRLSWIHTLRLGPLVQEEAENLAESTLGTGGHPSVVGEIWRQSEGNPLFVIELARWKKESDEPGQGARAVPGTIRAAVSDRLSFVSEESRSLLRTASVIGIEFRLNLLQALWNSNPPGQIVDLLGEAIDAKIVEPHTTDSGRYRFTHQLVHMTLYDELIHSEKARLHGALARCIESMSDGSPENHADELAYHFTTAVDAVGPEPAIHYSVLAGRSAMKALAYHEAATHYTAVLSLVDADDKPRRAEALAALARANFAEIPGGSKRQGWSLLKTAFALLVELGETDKAIELASLPVPLWQLEGVPDFYADALRLTTPNSLQAGWLHTRLAIGLFDAGRMEEAAQNLRSAEQIATELDNRELKARIALHWAQFYGRNDELDEAEVWAWQAIELADKTEAVENQLRARWQLGMILPPLGKLKEAERVNLDLYSRIDSSSNPFHEWTALSQAWVLARMRGDWERSEQLALRGQEMSPGDPYVDLLRLSISADVEGFENGSNTFEVWKEHGDSEFWRDTGPSLTNHFCEVPELQPLVIQRARNATENLPNPVSRSKQTIVLGLIACARGDKQVADDCYQELKKVRRPLDTVLDVSLDRVRGLLCVTRGDRGEAYGYFEEALNLCEAVGYRTELARIHADYAETIAQFDGPASQRLVDLAKSGLEIAGSLRMQPLVTRLKKLQDMSQPDQAGVPGNPDGLTDREVTVLRLLACGLTNRDIATELVLSVYTVNNHVTHIYQKIGASNRSDATAYALRLGIVK